MKPAPADDEIRMAFVAACLAELDALKPGNVHRHSAGHGMVVAHFENAAEAASGPIADSRLSVGQKILRATEASFAAAGLNTNLGIVLLCAPLAKAASETTFDVGLRRRLALVLGNLDERDADDAFAAIRLANPAGLGTVEAGDVRSSVAKTTLIQAMHLAAERDRIANAYVTAYADIFDFALPLLQDARHAAPDENVAISALHMALLAEFLDTHIVRKHGLAAAEEVRQDARTLRPQAGARATAKWVAGLAEFDADLKAKGRNPGTTADFVVATLFTDRLMAKKHS